MGEPRIVPDATKLIRFTWYADDSLVHQSEWVIATAENIESLSHVKLDTPVVAQKVRLEIDERSRRVVR